MTRPNPSSLPPRLADGIELIGQSAGSGYKKPPSLVRRGDGQVIQLTRLLYLVAEAADGSRDEAAIADLVSDRFDKTVSADNVRTLVEEKLRPLGILAAADGSSPKIEKPDPLLALKFRKALIPERASMRVASLFTRRSTRFISTGRRAFAQVDGRTVPLDDDDVKEMRVRGGEDAGEGGLDGLDLTKWFDNPQIGEGDTVEGAPTERITGELDPVAALNDLLSLSLRFGASEEESPRILSGAGADRVRDAVSSAIGELVTGKDDRLLRHLEVEILMKPDADQEQLRSALGNLVATRLQFTLDVSALNTPVEVGEPR